MDPNAALAELQQLVKRNRDREFVSDDDAARIIELFDALDGWLSNGGFLPNLWEENR